MTDAENIAHIPKPQHQDNGESWCGKRLAGFHLINLDHAANCVISQSYVQPCPKCVREAVAVLMGANEYQGSAATLSNQSNNSSKPNR